MSYISYFSFTLQTSEALLISYFSTFYFYFSTLQFYFSTLLLFFYIENPNPKFLNLRLNASSSMGTHCQVSSQLIKKNSVFFWQSSISDFARSGSRTPDPLSGRPTLYRCAIWAVDKDASFVVCNIFHAHIAVPINMVPNVHM